MIIYVVKVKKLLIISSNKFYLKCPSTEPVLIDSLNKLKRQVEFVDELINLHASESVMNKRAEAGVASVNEKTLVAPVDEAYAKLRTELAPLDPAGEQYAMLKKYVENTRNVSVPGVHSWNGNCWDRLRLLDAFEVAREGEATKFAPSKALGGR